MQQNENTTTVNVEEEGLDLKKMLYYALAYWKVLLASLIVCVAAAFFYLRVAVPTYPVSAKILLGDRGRAERQAMIDKLYSKGLEYYANSEWEKAIEEWQAILILNKRYDPAILGIESARSQIEMYQRVRESMFFEE